MRVLLTGGGTGGHVYPALAIAEMIKNKCPDAQIAFVGTEKGIENRLVPQAGYPLYHIQIQGIRRSLSPANLKTAYLVLTSPSRAKKIIHDFEPDLVIGTGGYVCWPLLRAAASMGIPNMVHESNALPGVAVRQLQKKVDVILTNFEETRTMLKAQEKVIHVGNPIRQSCSTVDREAACERLGIDPSKFVVLSFGGSLGAPAINEAALDLMRGLSGEREEIVQIVATGARHFEHFGERFAELGLQSCPRWIVKDYIDDMPTYMAAADLVLCRAGAMTLTELAMMRKSAILIPSPYVTDNHQYKNAKVLADAGAAILLEEKDSKVDGVCDAVAKLLDDSVLRMKMSSSIADFARQDTADRIWSEIEVLLRRKRVIVEKE